MALTAGNEIPARIVLIGPSGAGKSEVARCLAERLGYAVFDTDALIVERIGMPIAAFFRQFGEPAFRAIETEVVAQCADRDRIVVATGGGAVLHPANWLAWRPRSVVLGLTAAPETLVERVRKQAEHAGNLADRPLLAGDAVGRMQAMLASRAPFYSQADCTIDTDRLDLEEVVERALTLVRRSRAEQRVPLLSIRTPTERSDIFVGRGARRTVSTMIRQRWPSARTVWAITDENVAAHWLPATLGDLESAGLKARSIVVPAGEASKRMEVLADVCQALTEGGVGRRDVVLALGGGVVGDLGGFVAAICLRGLALVQLPTSLLAMVDSSVGGKTGVNNRSGKNMIGAFYQPGVVVVDPDFLSTLPRDEYRSGMAEVVKHAVIQPTTPFGGTSLWQALERLACLDPIDADAIEATLAVNIGIKHSVVQADEREAGLRMILNFGHTAGHAIEADGYRYRHGEAVALGMLVASSIAEQLGRVDAAWTERLSGALIRSGLPVRVEGSADEFISSMAIDKKAADGALTWILPRREGGVEAVRGVPREVVAAALRAIGAT